MKAWQMPRLGDPRRELEAVELSPPEAPPGSVRIRVDVSDLNFADILQCQGSYQVKWTPPFTPGMVAAGVVEAAGAGTAFAAGERVVGPTVEPNGGFAEQCMLLAEQSHRIPAAISSRAAMAVHITYATAWFAFHRRAHLVAGESILVLAAAGGVGTAAVQMARAHGCWVIGAVGGSAKAEVATRAGADLVIDYEADDLYRRVMDATDGRGVDVVYDPVGGRHFDTVRRLLAWEGRLLVIGFAGGKIPAAPANHLLVKNYSVVGVHMGGYRERDPELVAQCYADVYRQLADGTIKPLISEVVGFDALPDALERLGARKTVGRVLFDPSRGSSASA
ncbi:MAG: NADPH:quinone oxidoreductase family protein [Gammaproteobacteria bacterium]|nr:NADPH:quinone oxidoreductase family protein [Gammaproteobacteria bacterium]